MILPHESRPWNPLIANTFYRAGVIERWGSGTTNMVHWCEENGNPMPSWQERNDSVVVTFYPPEGVLSSVGSKVIPKVTSKVILKVPPRSPPKLPPKLRNSSGFVLNHFLGRNYSKVLRYRTANISVKAFCDLPWLMV